MKEQQQTLATHSEVVVPAVIPCRQIVLHDSTPPLMEQVGAALSLLTKKMMWQRQSGAVEKQSTRMRNEDSGRPSGGTGLVSIVDETSRGNMMSV